MSIYVAVEAFKDKEDNNYQYNVGDEYPREGYSPSAARIESLLSSNNDRNRPVLGKLPPEDEKLAESERTKEYEEGNQLETD